MFGSDEITSASSRRDVSSFLTICWRWLRAGLGARDMNGLDPLLEDGDRLNALRSLRSVVRRFLDVDRRDRRRGRGNDRLWTSRCFGCDLHSWLHVGPDSRFYRLFGDDRRLGLGKVGGVARGRQSIDRDDVGRRWRWKQVLQQLVPHLLERQPIGRGWRRNRFHLPRK